VSPDEAQSGIACVFRELHTAAQESGLAKRLARRVFAPGLDDENDVLEVKKHRQAKSSPKGCNLVEARSAEGVSTALRLNLARAN
jgi:hypothetical protein